MNRTALPPSQPRRFASLSFGLGNIIIGCSYFITAKKTPVTKNLFGPLWAWGILFVVAGLLVYTSSKSITHAYYSALFAIFVWMFVSVLLLLAVNTPFDPFNAPHSPIVTVRYPISGVVIAFWHMVLLPYWRRPYR